MMKYIVVENLDTDKEEIFTFPTSVDHDCMMEAIARIKDQSWGNWKRIPRMPISVGFVKDGLTCYGESITLGLKSRGASDTLLILRRATE